MTMTKDLYRKLAVDGNKAAQAIVDSEEETVGAVPQEEAEDEGSESTELAEWTALQTQVNALVAKAEERAAAAEETEGTEDAGEEEDEDEDEETTEDLAAFAQKVGALKAQAEILAAAGDYKAAGDAHMLRADRFYWRDQHAEASSAYRDAAWAYSRHADEACAQLSAEQIKAWNAKRSSQG